MPGQPAAAEVQSLPPDINQLWQESRRSMAAGAPTAATMICRKLLMNVAEKKGAKKNQTFASYVDWLSANGYIPPDGKAWVEKIKDAGNEANHELPNVDQAKATEVMKFTQYLLTFVFELGPIMEEGPTAP